VAAAAELPAAAASSKGASLMAAATELPTAAELPAAVSFVLPVVSPVAMMHDSVCLATHVSEGSPTAGSEFVSFPPGLPNFVYGATCLGADPGILVSDGRVAEGTGVFLGGRYSNEELISFGGIPNANASIRSSERIRAQYNADDTQMDRAMHLAEEVLMRTQIFFYILFRMMILLLEL
jgi:hypothetical protein